MMVSLCSGKWCVRAYVNDTPVSNAFEFNVLPTGLGRVHLGGEVGSALDWSPTSATDRREMPLNIDNLEKRGNKPSHNQEPLGDLIIGSDIETKLWLVDDVNDACSDDAGNALTFDAIDRVTAQVGDAEVNVDLQRSIQKVDASTRLPQLATIVWKVCVCVCAYAMRCCALLTQRS